MTQKNFEGVDKDTLRKLSERTGGLAFFPKDETDLRAAFAQIEQELRSQYLIAYSPTNKSHDGTYRKVEIEVVNPELRKQKLLLNYRQGYFAQGEWRSVRRDSAQVELSDAYRNNRNIFALSFWLCSSVARSAHVVEGQRQTTGNASSAAIATGI